MNLKVMIPTQTAGALIGKNGETIAMIQKETSCRVKMSKNSDFFPCNFVENLSLTVQILEYILKKFFRYKRKVSFDNGTS